MSNEANDALQKFVDRIERLSEERTLLSSDVREVYAKCKDSGYDPRAVREIIRIRKMNKNDLDAMEQAVHLYRQALGM
jgi:uncharacterized protein (UPF0335 family)